MSTYPRTLRAKITDAVYDHPRADDIVTAVMGAIENDLLAVISDLESLIGDAAKSSVRELAPDLAHRIECLTGCIECGDHPGAHCDWCNSCPCACVPHTE